MSEENKMTEENKKTIIAFIAGLLIGGLLVFIFVEPARDAAIDTVDNDSESEMSENEEDNADREDDEDTTNTEDEDADEEDTASSEDDEVSSSPVTIVTDGAIDVDDQDAGSVATFGSIEFPARSGWIGVRDYENGQMGSLLGVARFNLDEGLTPNSVRLLRAMEAGNTYAVVFYSDNGDKRFSLANDVQLSGVMETFEAE